jgi:hypothetical protein
VHQRRLVGIDLGIISEHTVRVLAGDGSVVCRRKAVPTVDSLTEAEQALFKGRRRELGWRWCLNPRGRRGCRSWCSWPAAGTSSTGSARALCP